MEEKKETYTSKLRIRVTPTMSDRIEKIRKKEAKRTGKPLTISDIVRDVIVESELYQELNAK